ncbi:response regulator transcription factor [Mucilaginibacter gynuensis]|uniref:Response regulator transcription factor n=1 Tax=Mucilaginibacter gynuensis TaxID=1302236 RepID=A0ABP8HIH5_9SPHI
MATINVAIVDDQNLFRQSLALLVNTVADFKLVAEAEHGQDFLDKLAALDEQVDVAIIDMDMPDMNGIELNRILHEQYPGLKVVILSVHVHERLITQMVAAGAAAYLAKNCNKDELILAINTVHTAGFYFNANVLKAIKNSENHKFQIQKNFNTIPIKLTEREKQLLELICKEYSNAEIATALYLSVRTVEGHRNNLILKTGCRNTAGLVLFAIKHNLFKLPF